MAGDAVSITVAMILILVSLILGPLCFLAGGFLQSLLKYFVAKNRLE